MRTRGKRITWIFMGLLYCPRDPHDFDPLPFCALSLSLSTSSTLSATQRESSADDTLRAPQCHLFSAPDPCDHLHTGQLKKAI